MVGGGGVGRRPCDLSPALSGWTLSHSLFIVIQLVHRFGHVSKLFPVQALVNEGVESIVSSLQSHHFHLACSRSCGSCVCTVTVAISCQTYCSLFSLPSHWRWLKYPYQIEKKSSYLLVIPHNKPLWTDCYTYQGQLCKTFDLLAPYEDVDERWVPPGSDLDLVQMPWVTRTFGHYNLIKITKVDSFNDEHISLPKRNQSVIRWWKKLFFSVFKILSRATYIEWLGSFNVTTVTRWWNRHWIRIST